MLPSQFDEFRKTTRVHELELDRLLLRDTTIVSVDVSDTPEIDLARVKAALEGITIGAGDAVLLRTGWGDDVTRFKGTARYVLDSPYLTADAAEHLGQVMRARVCDVLVVDTALVSRPSAHLVPQWARMNATTGALALERSPHLPPGLFPRPRCGGLGR